jgi:hypothetical protein
VPESNKKLTIKSIREGCFEANCSLAPDTVDKIINIHKKYRKVVIFEEIVLKLVLTLTKDFLTTSQH